MRILIPTVAALVAVIAIGCQHSAAPTPAETAASPQHAVVVTGNGGSVVVFEPSNDPANPVVYCSAGTEICPECKAAAIKYFQTGILDPKCSRTGATRTATTIAYPNHAVN